MPSEGFDGTDSEDELLRRVPVPAQLLPVSASLAPAPAAVPLAGCVLGALRDGVRSQAVLFDAAVAPARRAEALLELLAEVCQGDPRAECVLLCEREQLRGPEFAQLARAELGGPDQAAQGGAGRMTKLPEDALRRVHIKYVPLASSAGGPPPLVRVLALLQNLPFAPAAVAVLGLARLARGGGHVPDTIPGGAAASAAGPPDARSHALLGAASVDAQQAALAAALLADAAIQVAPPGGCAAFALLCEEAAPAGPQAEAQQAMLGCSFEAVWCAHHSSLGPAAALVAAPIM